MTAAMPFYDADPGAENALRYAAAIDRVCAACTDAGLGRLDRTLRALTLGAAGTRPALEAIREVLAADGWRILADGDRERDTARFTANSTRRLATRTAEHAISDALGYVAYDEGVREVRAQLAAETAASEARRLERERPVRVARGRRAGGA